MTPALNSDLAAAVIAEIGTSPKCFLTISGYSRTAVSMSVNRIPWASRSSRFLWYTTSESYWLVTPAEQARFNAGRTVYQTL